MSENLEQYWKRRSKGISQKMTLMSDLFIHAQCFA